MKRHFCLVLMLMCLCCGLAAQNNSVKTAFGEGTLVLRPLTDNAVRVQYMEGEEPSLPELVYVDGMSTPDFKWDDKRNTATLKTASMQVRVDKKKEKVVVCDTKGSKVFEAYAHELDDSNVGDMSTKVATMEWGSPEGEYLNGLGQFQDGYANIRGLMRRLTQVNTQISIPMLISDRGYGILWNNYGMTEWNPSDKNIRLVRGGAIGEKRSVNVSGQGSEIKVRQDGAFTGELIVEKDGDYALMLDVGQKMASVHHLEIDGKEVINFRNTWLPPTASVIVPLTKGRHEVVAKLEHKSLPSLHYRLIDNSSSFRSPVAECVDYTVFVGNADEVVTSYRQLTGPTALVPKWALGYIHCRERYKTQDELLQNARTFREKNIPLDLIVQDWQYWGRYGWNAMKFDETQYPDPAKMVDELHKMDMRLMLSVWSKVDHNSELGKEMARRGYYIEGTPWIDFFNPEAAAFYWESMNRNLLQPYQIDAWWQDATEPENDDLEGRYVEGGKTPGEVYRNVYPLLVSKTVYEGLRKDDAERRSLIFTRSAYAGAQRYGATVWTGDVGNDFETLRRQIVSGLGIASAGMTWWTYDAGGFFRPYDQYTNKNYIETMIRWVQTSAFLPMMRIHGYMSDTEPWRYGTDAERIITDYIKLRYRMLPYIYSEAARVTFDGHTIMRPMLFDFANDKEALKHDTQFMFGSSVLVNPVLSLGVKTWLTYLPEHKAGWYDFWTGEFFEGGKIVEAAVSIDKIPVFVKAGTIMPVGDDVQHSAQHSGKPLQIRIYRGADALFTLYEDEGDNYNYEKGLHSHTTFTWDEENSTISISDRAGWYDGMKKVRQFEITDGTKSVVVDYNGTRKSVSL